MELKPGSRWKSAVCDSEVVVVRASKTPCVLECGGHAVVAHAAERPTGLTLAADRSDGTLTGKRYVDDETGVEILCSKGGKGSLSMDGRPLQVKAAKALPSSD
jgi:ketosteroid isomerase-like protein